MKKAFSIDIVLKRAELSARFSRIQPLALQIVFFKHVLVAVLHEGPCFTLRQGKTFPFPTDVTLIVYTLLTTDNLYINYIVIEYTYYHKNLDCFLFFLFIRKQLRFYATCWFFYKKID